MGMADREYYGSANPVRTRRFVAVASAVGLLVAYSTALPLKWVGLMPDRMTWFGLVAAPGAMFGLIAWSAWAPVVFPRRPQLGLFLGLLLVIAVLVLVHLERG
jgi:hypothetical protein